MISGVIGGIASGGCTIYRRFLAIPQAMSDAWHETDAVAQEALREQVCEDAPAPLPPVKKEKPVEMKINLVYDRKNGTVELV